MLSACALTGSDAEPLRNTQVITLAAHSVLPQVIQQLLMIQRVCSRTSWKQLRPFISCQGTTHSLVILTSVLCISTRALLPIRGTKTDVA
jgi:hypothetical protein